MDLLVDEAQYDYVVCEMSSYMIQSLSHVSHISLAGVLFVNMYQAHLDWHRGLQQYHRDKMSIFAYTDVAVVHSSVVEAISDTDLSLPDKTAVYDLAVEDSEDGADYVLDAHREVVSSDTSDHT